MFDTPPSNLPVEPTQPKPPLTPPVPLLTKEGLGEVSPNVDKVPGTGKKEPEDIFAELDKSAPATTTVRPVVEESRRSPIKIIILLVLILAVVGLIGGAIWYFFVRSSSVATEKTVAPSSAQAVVPAESEPIVEVPPALPEPQPEIPPPVSITTPAPNESSEVAVVPPNGVDSDGDGLTDAEETIFGTDKSVTDSDGDGFADGSEAKSLYDPAIAKTKLASSDRFQTVKIGSVNSALIPETWTSAETEVGITINTYTPALFLISILSLADKPDDLTFENWVLSESALPVSELTPFTTSAGYNAWRSSDGLVTVVIAGAEAFIVRYGVNDAASVDFRALYGMFVDTLKE
ncbi:MAG: thrombospondin type 3 repeat-containing protein [Patescibacteria group bacterium]